MKPPHGQETIDIEIYLTLFYLNYGFSYAYEIQRRLNAKKLLQLEDFHLY